MLTGADLEKADTVMKKHDVRKIKKNTQYGPLSDFIKIVPATWTQDSEKGFMGGTRDENRDT
jgi:hypothetical protein